MSFKNQSSGSALVVVIILTAVLFSVVTAYQNIILSEKRQILSSQNNLKAMAIAEAGLEHAFWEFLHNAAQFKPSDSWVVHPTINDTVSKSVNDFTNNLSAAIGSYTVQVQDFSSESPLITSTGTVTSAGVGTSAMIKAGVKKNEVFNHALLAQGQITLEKEALVDSYDLSKGNYGAALMGGGVNIEEAGHVQTNSTEAGNDKDNAIYFKNDDATIKGNATTGLGGAVSNEDRVTGEIKHDSNEAITPVTVPTFFDGIASGGKLEIDKNEVVILSDENRVYEEIKIKGKEDNEGGAGGKLQINGDVNIYVTKKVIIDKNGELIISTGSSLNIYVDEDFDAKTTDGTVQNNTLNPRNFHIYLTSTGDVGFKKNAEVYAIIIAPNGSLDVKQDAVLYGAAIVDTASLKENGAIHYDESLGTAGGTNTYEMTWWRRM